MASLANILNNYKPKNAAPPSFEQELKQQQQQQKQRKKQSTNAEIEQQQLKAKREIPPYGHRQQSGWIPKTNADFGEDGGSYPEIHVAQFPQGMGRKDNNREQHAVNNVNNNCLTLVVDPNQPNMALNLISQQIVKQGQPNDKIVYTNYTDLIEHQVNEDVLIKPDEELLKENSERTRQELERIVQTKITATHGRQKQNDASNQQQEESRMSYFRYTTGSSESDANTRIVKVAEAQVDPMEPPKFHIKKIPRGPPSPPVTVMHSPDRKLTKEEAENWKIPPAISNWKNPKGFTIPLHQRVAADGRGLQEVQINDRFATLAEAMYIAEREARKEVESRAELQKKLLLKQQEEKDEKLRELARRARTARFGGLNAPQESPQRLEESEIRAPADTRASTGVESDSDISTAAGMDEEELKREQLRLERAREHRYEKRKGKLKKRSSISKVDEEQREITEKIALGQVSVSGALNEELDVRLTSAAASGLGSGFSSDDSYNIYDRTLFHGSSANQIYRPTKEAMESYSGGMNDIEGGLEGETGRFTSGIPTKTFKGSREGDAVSRASGPVQFEREQQRQPEQAKPDTLRSSREKAEKRSERTVEQEEDVFGFGKYLADAKQGKKRTFDHIGKGGFMRATGGGSSTNPEDYRDAGSKRRKINFQSAGSSK